MDEEDPIKDEDLSLENLNSTLTALYRYNPVVAMDESMIESYKLVDEEELQYILENWMDSYNQIMNKLDKMDEEELLKGEHADIIQKIEESKEEAEKLLSSLEE